MKVVKCPNCQNILTLDPCKEYINCDKCDSSFVNPVYSDAIYIPDEEYVEQKVNKVEKQNTPIKEQKPINKKAIVISIIAIASVMLIATIVMGSITIVNYAPDMKFDSIVNKLVEPEDIYVSNNLIYDEESKSTIVKYLHAEYYGGERELMVYYFKTSKDAEKYFNYYKAFLSYDEEIQRIGRYVYVGENLGDII